METLSSQELRDRLPEILARVRVSRESFVVTHYRRPALIISPPPEEPADDGERLAGNS